MKSADESTPPIASRLEATRGGRRTPSTDEWRDAFEHQCTTDLVKRARRYAVYRAGFLGHGSGRTASAYAEDLVQHIVQDTISGVLTWQPDKRSLLAHVLGYIRQRSWRDAEVASRRELCSLDADVESPLVAEVEASLSAQAARATAATTARAEEVLAALYELAGNQGGAASGATSRAVDADDDEGRRKAEVLRYLGAIAEGATAKEEIMELARLDERGYRTCRRRIAKLTAQLPLYLQPNVPATKRGQS